MQARQTPTWEANVPDAPGDSEYAALLASQYFGEPLPWQRRVLGPMLARDGRDRYAAHSVALSVPRQNGKSWVVRARCLYGIVCSGEKILYTCQHGDTADEMFKALSAPFEDEDNEELSPLLRAVRKTNGQQAIYLTNGGRVRFTTRTNSLARGKSYDVLVYDEAQELTQAQQAASLPTISASAKHNTQTLFLGTPPGPECNGDVFRGMHSRVHAGKSKCCWMEWAVTEIGDVSDVSRWYEANPSLGTLIDEGAVRAEMDAMATDAFARERLGWWAPEAGQDLVIPRREWDACRVPLTKVPERGVTCYGVKFAPDGSRGALAVCVRPDDGPCFVEAVGVWPMAGGTGAFVDWLSARRARCAQVSIDGASNAQTLVDRLYERKFPKRAVLRCGVADVTSACAALEDAVRGRKVAHCGQEGLTASVCGSARRPVGRDGAWAFELGAEGDPCLAEAAALALRAAQTTKRRPGRGSRLI